MNRIKREIRELNITGKIKLNDETIKAIIDYIKKNN